jgi:hypothetical protein
MMAAAGLASVLGGGKDYSGEQSALWDSAIKGMKLPYGSAQASLYKALGAIDKGYGNAQSALTQQGAVATKALLDREKAQMGVNKQSLQDRGLYSSTVYDAVNRGTTSDTNAALSDLNAQLAMLGSNVKISQGQAQANVLGQISGLHQNYMQSIASLGAGKAANVQQGKQGGYGDDIIGMLGMIYGGQGPLWNAKSTGRGTIY